MLVWMLCAGNSGTFFFMMHSHHGNREVVCMWEQLIETPNTDELMRRCQDKIEKGSVSHFFSWSSWGV